MVEIKSIAGINANKKHIEMLQNRFSRYKANYFSNIVILKPLINKKIMMSVPTSVPFRVNKKAYISVNLYYH